jgi:hypothetical protein
MTHNNERLTAEEFAELERKYGHLSEEQIQAEIDRELRLAAEDYSHAAELRRYQREHPMGADGRRK